MGLGEKSRLGSIQKNWQDEKKPNPPHISLHASVTLIRVVWLVTKHPFPQLIRGLESPSSPPPVDIPRRLTTPNELNGVCVASGCQSCCRYRSRPFTSRSARSFPLLPPGYGSLESVTERRTVRWESVWLMAAILGRKLDIVWFSPFLSKSW